MLLADNVEFSDGIRRIRRWRLVANSLWLCLLMLAAAICLQRFVPVVGAGLGVGFGVATGLLALALTVGRCAFAFGLVRCPRCRAPFDAPLHARVGRQCASCGFDISKPERGPA